MLECQDTEDAGRSYKQLQQIRAIWPEGKTYLDLKGQIKPNDKQSNQTQTPKPNPVILYFLKKTLLFFNLFFS